MGQLVDGEWHSGQSFANASGQFVRQTSSFRERITADGSSGFPAEAGRYHLYVARACPWCHRATGIVPIGSMLDFTTPHGREE